MRNSRFSMFAIFAAIVMVPSLAQETAVTNDKATPIPTEYSDAEYRISSSLTDETIVDGSETPLAKLLLDLSGMHDIKISIDKQAFTDLGMSPDQPVTFAAKHVPLCVAIGRLTDKLNLTYIVRDDSLLLTSTKVAAREQSVKVIMVAKTLKGREEKIIKQVTRSVSPGTWKSGGGNCEIRANGTKFTIVGNERLFQDVGVFLNRMSEEEETRAKAQTNTE